MISNLLFCVVLFCFVCFVCFLFCFVFCFVCFVLFFVLFCFVFCFVLFCFDNKIKHTLSPKRTVTNETAILSSKRKKTEKNGNLICDHFLFDCFLSCKSGKKKFENWKNKKKKQKPKVKSNKQIGHKNTANSLNFLFCVCTSIFSFFFGQKNQKKRNKILQFFCCSNFLRFLLHLENNTTEIQRVVFSIGFVIFMRNK